jgi:DNA-nicking Smr family endonuclease
MAKKRKNRAKAQPQDFSNNPFKKLKGLSAFEEKNHATASDETLQEEKNLADADVEEQSDSFAAEMAFLGVEPLEDGQRDRPGIVAEDDGSASTAGSADAQDDATVFLDAVGSMEEVFKDEWSEDVSEKRAVPRRMRQLERGQLLPEDELDLHGLNVDEARTKTRFFLQNAVFQGLHTVLLITGKGLHSADGPVLRSAMEKFLSENNELVVEWGVAPRRYGGDGALVVFLRPQEAKNN